MGPAASDTTDGSGNYSLTGLTPGDYVVVEVLTDQTGWFQSDPSNDVLDAGLNTGTEVLGEGGYAISLTSGETDTGNDFGNYQAATKSGTKYHDANADGTRDSGDAGLSGWTILAFADDGDGILEQAEYDLGPAASDTTDGSGNYSLTGLTPGDYVVVEVLTDQTGWFQSDPSNDVLDAGLNTGTEVLGEGGYAISLTSGELDSGNDFGNYQQATKSGTKFNDLNENGTRDSGEPGLSGWTILAYEDTDGNMMLSQAEYDAGPAASDTTDGAGLYSLTGLNPGDYIVVEVLQDGWTQSAPASTVAAGIDTSTGPDISEDGYAITLSSGETDTGNDFGNFQPQEGPGVRTPGFYQNETWQLFWDGIVGNEPEQSGTEHFPDGEITYMVDSNGDMMPDSTGLLIGDYNKTVSPMPVRIRSTYRSKMR